MEVVMALILSSAVSALDSFGVGMRVITHNVANISTEGFRSSRARYGDNPDYGGVRVEEIRRIPIVGRQDTEMARMRVSARDAVEAAAEVAAQNRLEEYRAIEAKAADDLQIERELTEAIITERAYEANMTMVRVYDDMLGTLIDIAV